MRDLYFDDIENKTYSDTMILEDLRALIKAGQREGPLLDYKSDLSSKDNWPSTVAAFANTFGGLIVFGVEGKNDQPRRLSGFDPMGVEVRTKLTSMVLDRIHPRPYFWVRVVTHDQDPTREVALLRVAEGRNPPYTHSKDSEHRVYIRAGAQKAEADYLQLSAFLRSARVRAHKPPSARLNCYNSKSTDLSAPIKLARMFSDLSYRPGTWALGCGSTLRLSASSSSASWRCRRDSHPTGPPSDQET